MFTKRIDRFRAEPTPTRKMELIIILNYKNARLGEQAKPVLLFSVKLQSKKLKPT